MNSRRWIVLFFGLVASYAIAGDKVLVASYRLDKDFKDSSGNGHDLKPLSEGQQFSKTGQTTWCFGPNTDRFLKLGASAQNVPSDISAGLTLSGFVRKTGGHSYGGVFFGFGEMEYGKTGLLIGDSYGFLQFKVGKSNPHPDPERRLADGKWHHLAIVIPPKNSRDEFDVYFDGAKLFSKHLERFDSYGEFMLGTIGPASGSEDQHLSFQIDNVKITGKAIPENEIKTEADLRLGYKDDQPPTPANRK